jgi:hypothetical protein
LGWAESVEHFCPDLGLFIYRCFEVGEKAAQVENDFKVMVALIANECYKIADLD